MRRRKRRRRRRLVGGFPGRSSASLVVILLVGSLPGRNSACGEALGLKWISVWNPSGSPRGLPLGLHTEICGELPWS